MILHKLCVAVSISGWLVLVRMKPECIFDQRIEIGSKGAKKEKEEWWKLSRSAGSADRSGSKRSIAFRKQGESMSVQVRILG